MSIEKYIQSKLVRSYQGKNVLITGGASGIGLEATKIFLAKGANLLLAVRNLNKAEETLKNLKINFPSGRISFYLLDLASFKSIRSFIDKLNLEKVDVDILINNAGVFNLERSLTEDGLEIVLGTNYFGVRYFNDLFFDYAKTLPHPVEVILSSSIAANIGKLNFEDFFFERKYSKLRVYGCSKRLIIHYYLCCLKKEKGSNVKYYLTHPGASFTPLILNAYPDSFLRFAKPFMKLFFHSPQKASLPYFLALEKQKSGFYCFPRGFAHFSGYPKMGKVNESLKHGFKQSQEYCKKIIDKIL